MPRPRIRLPIRPVFGPGLLATHVLLDAIVDQFSVGVYALPMRLLDQEPRSEVEFVSIVELLFETTLDAYIEHRSVMMVVVREQADPDYKRRWCRSNLDVFLHGIVGPSD